MEPAFPVKGKDLVCELFEGWIRYNTTIDSVTQEKYLALLLRFGRKKSYDIAQIRKRVEKLLDIMSPIDVGSAVGEFASPGSV